MARLELVEREICITQNAQERRDGVWNVWTNDNYWHRRLQSVGATVVSESESGCQYTLAQRQVLIRKIPARRQGPRVVHFQQRKASKAERRARHIHAPPEAVEAAGDDEGEV